MIGLEIHAQVSSNAKLFCSCPVPKENDAPNTLVCQICLGYPGAKPRLNERIVSQGLRLGIALGCKIASHVQFSRKTYFYPDLSKNFQITQYEEPLAEGGFLKLKSGKKIRLRRIHIEEDPAALTYPSTIRDSEFTLIDYNRSGTPLLEIVTEPDMTSPAEARDFLKELTKILEYCGILSSEGSLKADANVSIPPHNRVEVKNIGSFKEVESALAYEIIRQKATLAKGQAIVAETRGWDAAERTTFTLRSKESEDDYGYILEPDLARRPIRKDELAQLTKDIPELAHVKEERYVSQLKVAGDDAEVIASDKSLALFFEEIAKHVSPTLAGRWVRREVLRVLNYHKIAPAQNPIPTKVIVELLELLSAGKISEVQAHKYMELIVENNPANPKNYFSAGEHTKIGNKAELEKICKEILLANDKAVQDYKAGSPKAMNFLVGQVMRKTKGAVDPETVSAIFQKLLN